MPHCMRSVLVKVLPALYLARVATAFGAVANVWFVILWTSYAVQEPGTSNFKELPLWLMLVGGAVNALGLFAFTTALNDILDRRRDQLLHPDRPLPSGRLSLESAVMLVGFTLATAVLGSTVLGTMGVVLTLVVACAALVFNAAGKHIPAIGLVLLGLIHAGQMVTPNLHLKFVLPVWVVMTHSLGVAGAAHVYGGKKPGISRRAIVLAVIGWLFWSGVMLSVGWYRCRREGGLFPDWVNWRGYAIVGVLAGLFMLLTWLRVRSIGRGARVGEKIQRYGVFWLSLYACGWMVGQGYERGAVILGVLAALGFVGMTVVREVLLMMEQPMGYRR